MHQRKRVIFRISSYNDIPLVIDEEAYQKLRDASIDHLLAQHIAHLFIRDSVSLFSEKVHQNDEEDSDHFEVKPQKLQLVIFSIHI